MSGDTITPAAVILAGSRPGRPDPVAQAEGVPHKALADLAGLPLLAHVVTALRGAGIARIGVCASDGTVVALARELACEIIPAASGPSASVAAAFDALGAPLLVTTSDHALLRPEWVRQFLHDSPGDADVSVLLARREAVEAALPGSRRTYLRLADGHWSGCNLFLLATPGARRALDTWRTVEANRKKPWKIAAQLGPGMLIRFVTGRLTLAMALDRLGRKIGLTARAVAAADGLAAVDVDKPSDLADVRVLAGAPATP